MIIDKRYRRHQGGQTALILILLSAAALVFLAITMNWGRIAQTKTLITMGAYESASLMASEVASYGEIQKQTYLKDKNQYTSLTGVFFDFILVIIAIILLIIPIAQGASGWVIGLAAAALGASTATMVLQLVVINPLISTMWNKMQKNQPIQQQFYEGGISTALQDSVTDQVDITDYFDANANGVYGYNALSLPEDLIGRFAFFYSDRLRMLEQSNISQIGLFYDAIQTIDNEFTDPCTASNPGAPATYNPYCDPCCQPLSISNAYSGGFSPLQGNSAIAPRPSWCPADAVPVQCQENNPYWAPNPVPPGGPYGLIYDSTYQNSYTTGNSILELYGRDQQAPLGVEPPFNPLIMQGNFPNGIYPLFWFMKDYSPEVDNLNVAALTAPQYHWCTKAVTPAYTAPRPDLAQLNLGYACVGQDCCVNNIDLSLVGGIPSSLVSTSIDMFNKAVYVVGTSPEQDTRFGEQCALTPATKWVEGDNQFCSAIWPYNASTLSAPDGTCEWNNTSIAPVNCSVDTAPTSTVDSLDDMMHTLSDFVKFSNEFVGEDISTLSSTFNTWYPQVAEWIAPSCGGGTPGDALFPNFAADPICNDGGDGRLLQLYTQITSWGAGNPGGVLANWLANSYADPGAWCVPPAPVAAPFAGSAEQAAINAAGPWGTLPGLVACTYYNAVTAPNNYSACVTQLATLNAAGTCPVAAPPPACDAVTLGRSLYSVPQPPWTGSCDASVPGSFANWVQNSSTLFNDEAPKFSTRYQFLNQINQGATKMQEIFSGSAAAGITGLYPRLSSFFAPCGASPGCSAGGPATQLMYARQQGSPAVNLPNSVIYGWQDNPPPGGSGGCTDTATHLRVGCAHIVKVTAYSPGRSGTTNPVSGIGVLSLLPWIKTTTGFFTRSFTLLDRDGPVYVSVQRWDQDHTNILTFPNNHLLWQFIFHNPSGAGTLGTGIPAECRSLYPGTGLTTPIGFGLEDKTVQGLVFSKILPQDQLALQNAFMLNDSGNGQVDANASADPNYSTCITKAETLVASGIESHACAEYIASNNATHNPSPNGDQDYSIKFIDCNSIDGGSPPTSSP